MTEYERRLAAEPDRSNLEARMLIGTTAWFDAGGAFHFVFPKTFTRHSSGGLARLRRGLLA